MNTDLTWQINTTSLEDTLAVAARLGSKLRGGEVIELISDLGGGKTSFVRGLAQGLGSQDHVSSPSFTLTNQYQAGPLTIYHFDFYRLSEPGIMREELAEILADPLNIVVVEWGDVVEHVLPIERITLRIKVTGEVSRQLEFSFPAQYQAMFETS